MLAMLPAGQAKAAQRWTSPASTDASGSCIELAPCRIDHAITGAAAGDEVIVTPGEYPLSGPLVGDHATLPTSDHRNSRAV